MSVSLAKLYDKRPAGYRGNRNYRVSIPGSTVTCALGNYVTDRHAWAYTLWSADDTAILASGWLDLKGLTVRPDQVARIAFLLEVDYAK